MVISRVGYGGDERLNSCQTKEGALAIDLPSLDPAPCPAATPGEGGSGGAAVSMVITPNGTPTLSKLRKRQGVSDTGVQFRPTLDVPDSLPSVTNTYDEILQGEPVFAINSQASEDSHTRPS